MNKNNILHQKILEVINLASDLSINEFDQYAQFVELLIEGSTIIPPITEEEVIASRVMGAKPPAHLSWQAGKSANEIKLINYLLRVRNYFENYSGGSGSDAQLEINLMQDCNSLLSEYKL